ncbi:MULTISPECIES: NUDIX domain-containing protein [Streptomyces]|uniref:NUDIX domain-containing protein n=2 Tax=Streptomyces bacillaris TaxID=68179 RepID=A0ABW6DNI8_9ACTN|nr:NUDIX domain-containing protein [Streptomyces nanshensis]
MHLRDHLPGLIWEPGAWSLLGGGREPQDRSLEETVRRELREEAGLDLPVLEPYAVEIATAYGRCAGSGGRLLRPVERGPRAAHADGGGDAALVRSGGPPPPPAEPLDARPGPAPRGRGTGRRIIRCLRRETFRDE